MSSFKHALLWALLGGAAAMLLAFPLTFVLPFFAPDAEVRSLAGVYVLVVAASWIPHFLSMVCTRYFLSSQKNGVVAWISNLTVALNIGLNFIFIFGVGEWKGWGVPGSAFATLLARFFQFGVLALLILQDLRKKQVSFKKIRLSKEQALVFARQGVPLAQSNLAEFGAWFVFVGFIGQLGTASMAAHEISMKIKDVGYIFGWALATVGTTLVGQAVGAGNAEQARRSAQGTTLIAMGVMGSFGLVFLLFPQPLLQFFTKDPEVISQAVPLLRLMALYQLADAVYVGYRSGLNGMGEVKYVRNVALFGGWLIMAAGAFVFTRLLPWGLLGAWFSLTLFVALASTLYFFRFNKKVMLVGTQPPQEAEVCVPTLGAEEKL